MGSTHNLLSSAMARQETFLVAQGLPADVPRNVTAMVLLIRGAAVVVLLRARREGMNRS